MIILLRSGTYLTPLDPVVIVAVGVLAVTLTVLYRWIGRARQNYVNERDVTQAVVATFHGRLQKQIDKIEALFYEAQATRASVERLEAQVSRQSDKIEGITRGVETALMASKTMAKHMVATREQVNRLIEGQKQVQEQVRFLDERYRGMLPEAEAKLVTPAAVANLNPIELRVLQILVKEGPKSAPDLQRVIERTREHTARLMKRLFDHGYVERETHKIPYTYRISEKARGVIEEMPEKVLPKPSRKAPAVEEFVEERPSLAREFHLKLKKLLSRE